MGLRFRFLPGLFAAVLVFGLSGCDSGGSSSSSGTGGLFVATQGDSLVSTYSIDLSTGLVTAVGNGVATGNTPTVMLMSPSGNALFIANTASNNISTYTLGANLSLTTGSTVNTGMTPSGMAIDSAAHFLFVANQGLQIDPTSGTISVFSGQSGAGLTEVPGSPFSAAAPLLPSGPGPSAVAVTPDGKFLYVANQFDGTVTGFSVDGSGALTRRATVLVGTAPAGMRITPDGGFLYVANSGSSNVSAFAICNQVLTSCSDPNSPDGSLTPVAGSPFSAGLGPSTIVVTGSGKFMFVVDRQSNQISEYKVSTGTGVLTPNTQPSIGTGLTPAGAALRPGTTVVTTTTGTTDYLYVPNLGASTITSYGYDSTVGVLGLVGSAITTTGQPSAVATE
jgi:6-phosphogluconolactonase